MPTNVEIPPLGESVREAVLIKWHKKDGEQVNAQDPLCELETDKANVDLAAPSAGVLRHVKEEGETVHIGETIARIDESTAAAKPSAPKTDLPKPPASLGVPSPKKPASSAPTATKPTDLRPSVRRI